MATKTAEEIVDMLSELQTTLREEGANMDPPEHAYMAGLLRALRYAFGLEDTLSDTWRQARIPAPPPANTGGTDDTTRKTDGFGSVPRITCGCSNCEHLRKLAQMLIEEIGSIGPESAEDTVTRAVADLAEERRLRLCAKNDMHNMSKERDDAQAERDEARRLLRTRTAGA